MNNFSDGGSFGFDVAERVVKSAMLVWDTGTLSWVKFTGGGGGGGGMTDAQFTAHLPLAVTGPQTDAEFAARLPLNVTGPQTDAQFAARLPLDVTGPLTDVQFAARLPLAVTGPQTDAEFAARLPLGVADATLADLIGTRADRPTAYSLLDRLRDIGVKVDAGAKATNVQLAALTKVLTPKSQALSRPTLLHRTV